MDQNYTSYQQYTQPPLQQKNAAYYRQRGREALKGKWLYAIVAVLLLSLLAGSTGSFSTPSFNINIGGGAEGDLPALDQFVSVEGMATLMAIAAIIVAVVAVGYLLFMLLVGSPVKLGYQKFNLDLIDGKDAKIGTLFDYFKLCYGKSVLLSLLHGLIQLALTLPLLIGAVVFVLMLGANVFTGILSDPNPSAVELFDAIDVFGLLFGSLALLAASLMTAVLQVLIGYRIYFCYMIMAEYPEIGVVDALRNSNNLMRGKIWRLFCLEFSFIGWYFLVTLATVCTCGLGSVGFLALAPYVNASVTAFYDDIANRATARETEFPSIDPNDYIVKDTPVETAPEAETATPENSTESTEPADGSKDGENPTA